jgi:hypothetical protein
MIKTITYQALTYPLPPLDARALRQAGNEAINARESGDIYRAKLASLNRVEENLRQKLGVEVTRDRFPIVGTILP